jgi:hypothetical protein
MSTYHSSPPLTSKRCPLLEFGLAYLPAYLYLPATYLPSDLYLPVYLPLPTPQKVLSPYN